MRASLIALGAAFGLAVGSSGALAQQAAGAPAAPTGLQDVVRDAVVGSPVQLPGLPATGSAPAAPTGLQGVVEGAVVGSPVEYPGAPVVGSAPIVVGDSSFQPHPYSYYVTFPAPARTYVEYGALDQFPFYGRPYGRPGDRWSWSAMMGNGAAGLDRYYYQLLP